MFKAALASSRKRIRNRLVISPTRNLELLSVDRNSEATYVDASGIIQTAQPNELRIDYSTGSAKILSEGEATNFIKFSEDLTDDLWKDYEDEVSVFPNAAISPDGNNSATRILGNGVNGTFNRFFYSGLISVISNSNYTLSYYVKNINATDYATNVYGSNSLLLSETIDSQYISTEEWTKLKFTFHTGSEENIDMVHIFRGHEGEEVLFWGVQVSKNQTSYIPTSGTSVTRLADTITTTPPSWTKRIIETVDGEVNVINTIPATYQLPKGNIDQIEFR